jgi:hypothetical protein
MNQSGPYSHETDYFSFGRCVEDVVSEPIAVKLMLGYPEFEEYTGRLLRISDRMTVLAKRLTPLEINQKTMDLLVELLKLSRRQSIDGINTEYLQKAYGIMINNVGVRHLEAEAPPDLEAALLIDSDLKKSHPLEIAPALVPTPQQNDSGAQNQVKI